MLWCLYWLLWLSTASASIPSLLRRHTRLSYDAQTIGSLHSRAKRSSLSSSQPSHSPILISFQAPDYGRKFELELWPDDSTGSFHPEHVVEINGRPLSPSEASSHRQHHVHGRLKGEPTSTVFGSLRDGVFDGHIYTKDGGVFHVDKLSKYEDAPSDAHSILYADEDIRLEKLERRGRAKRAVASTGAKYAFKEVKENLPSRVGCPLEGDLKLRMDEMARSGVTEEEAVEEEEPLFHDEGFSEAEEGAFEKYLPDSQRRRRRQARTGAMDRERISGHEIYKVRTCSLYMQADQKLWAQVFAKEGQRDATRTREEILSLFDNHLKAVNHIYAETSFGGINGINFVIQRTSIYDEASCPPSRASGGNPFCEDRVDVSNYLNMNSKRNHSQFCLAYSMTYRDFIGGTLGLAWVASPAASTAGGVCEIYKMYSERSGRVWRSLNTGIITLVNYGNRVPPRVSQLTLAHEIGHNFGSPHDWPTQCQPGLPNGNFIMFSSATSGDKPNNAKFSPCSVANISNVLLSVLKERPVDPQRHLYSPSGGKRNCFSESTTAFCGNQIKEEGEECDCGFNAEDCARMKDSCCFPHRSAGPAGSVGCTRKPGARCSPSEGVCCTPQCGFKGQGVKCSEEGECVREQFCNALGPACPPPQAKPNGTLCQNNTKVCQAGACSKSICRHVGLEECFITEGSPDDKCELACLSQGKCLRSVEIPALKPYFQTKRRDKGILLRPGSPCNDYQGYCDIFLKCRSVDSNGPLSRLKNLLFNEKTLESVAEWVQEHWWAVVLMGIGLVLFMALFIKCCAVHTPSTNPRKPQAHSIYETLRHPGTLMRREGRSRSAAHSHHHRPHHREHRDRDRDRERERDGDRGRHHRQHRSREHGRERGNDIPLNGIPAQPVGPGPAVMVPVEPPPPYTAAAAMPPPSGGPPRGHRKNKEGRSKGGGHQHHSRR